MLNKGIFAKGMALLMSAYPEYQCSKETIELYRMNLQEYQDGDYEKTVVRHIRENKWFPKISELRQELNYLRSFRKEEEKTAALLEEANQPLLLKKRANPACPQCKGEGYTTEEIKVKHITIKGDVICDCTKPKQIESK